MCIAIYKPAGVTIPWESFKTSEANNDDGWGFAARTADNRLVVRRGVDHFHGFQAAFEPFAEHQCIIHFRMRTHGEVKKNNCHPFMVSNGLAVIHNGVVQIACNVNKAKSDTWHFNELVLREFYANNKSFWRKPSYRFCIEQMSGGSKFVFLRADGAHSIYNQDAGHWKNGAWFSNYSYATASYGRSVGYYSSAWSKGRYDDDRYERWWDERKPFQKPLALIGGPEPTLDIEISATDSEISDEAALLEYERQIEEAHLASRGQAEPTAEEDAGEDTELEVQELTPAQEQEAAANIAARLFDEGMSAEALGEIDELFGVDGLEALADLLPGEVG
jgi:glutamine amidotransferase